MWIKIFSYGMVIGLIASTSVSARDASQDVAKASTGYALSAPESHDIIGNLLDEVKRHAESQPSINAQNLYDYIKTLRFEAKTKQEINACNFLMSYFRLQSNDQSGNVIREKLANLSEAMLWLERKKSNKLSPNYLTDFRIVTFLVSNEVFPHLTSNNMKLVLNEAKKYKDEASQRAALNALTAEGGSIVPHIMDEKQIGEAQLVFNHFQSILSQIKAAVTKDTDVEAEIIRLQNQLNNLKREEFEINGKKYHYTKNMIKQLSYAISNQIASLILYRNNDNIATKK